MDKIEALNKAVSAVLAAGKEILEVYHTPFEIMRKDDQSPLTLADKRAHQVIERCLAPLNIPILSEEGRDIPYDERKNWPLFWIVDPLDGTKEFIKRNDEFTVNIALIENGRPIIGVVYIPVTGRLYFGSGQTGSFRIDQAHRILGKEKGKSLSPDIWSKNLLKDAVKLPIGDSSRKVFTVLGSRSHPSPELEEVVEILRREHGGQIEFMLAGSSLKMCLVAEGSADIYPRLGSAMEWDTAAGQAVAEFAGARVYAYNTKERLTYNKADLLNPWFVVEKAI
ncbi:MAG: 3'(2'),5'-bisphosphate nucleotidase CysQ [Deltaproteobacteria bacterium]|nr:3'(2'),5'-bisphosphate nucleotidase CysQ [Deltaproteobacteria bacterium]